MLKMSLWHAYLVHSAHSARTAIMLMTMSKGCITEPADGPSQLMDHGMLTARHACQLCMYCQLKWFMHLCFTMCLHNVVIAVWSNLLSGSCFAMPHVMPVQPHCNHTCSLCQAHNTTPARQPAQAIAGFWPLQ
jgi:hypothetical protein